MPEVATGGALCLGLLHVDGGFGRVAASAFGFYATALSGNEAKLCRVKAFGGLLELRVELGDALIVNATLFCGVFPLQERVRRPRASHCIGDKLLHPSVR